MTEEVTIYDISTDTRRPITQADVDRWEELFAQLSIWRTSHDDIGDPNPVKFPFRLACYTNPMRSDGLFVAEEKEIEPYEIRSFDGKLLYPSIPKTKYVLGWQLPHEFARELVRRWNHFASEPNP